jgi:hypothetical protein
MFIILLPCVWFEHPGHTYGGFVPSLSERGMTRGGDLDPEAGGSGLNIDARGGGRSLEAEGGGLETMTKWQWP